MRSKGMFTLIGATKFEIEGVFCDICGWGDVMIHENIIHDGRKYDFCKRHTPEEIVTYIEMKLDPFKTSEPPPTKNELNKKQFRLL